MLTIVTAAKHVLRNRAYALSLIVLIPIMFSVFVTTPVYVVPGNTFSMQFMMYKSRDYALLSVLSVLTSVFLLMHFYGFRNNRKAKTKLGIAAEGGVGTLAAFLAAIFGATVCPICVGSLFGFLSFSAMVFLIQYHFLVLIVMLLLMSGSLYFTSKTVHGTCEKCTMGHLPGELLKDEKKQGA